jgi:hypothetical protein
VAAGVLLIFALGAERLGPAAMSYGTSAQPIAPLAPAAKALIGRPRSRGAASSRAAACSVAMPRS